MTEGVRKAVETYTGAALRGCPWRAFTDELVTRVMRVMPFFESGQLAFVTPAPSHRTVEAIGFYHSVSNRMHGMEMEHERAERERTRGNDAPPNTTRIVRGSAAR